MQLDLQSLDITSLLITEESYYNKTLKQERKEISGRALAQDDYCTASVCCNTSAKFLS